jgi:type I restriction enzyme S subunit
MVRLGDVLTYIPRPVSPNLDTYYREIGIRSHGRGIFHKPPTTGAEIGSKRVFRIEPGDFVLNIVFAWEGAVAIVSDAEKGMIASHRFPAFQADPDCLEVKYLPWYFRTVSGRDLLGRVSPGGAGRNRTLNRAAFLQQPIPLPPLPEQRRIVAKLDLASRMLDTARGLRQEATYTREVLFGSFSRGLFDSFDVHQPIETFADVRGGIQKSPHRMPGANPVRYLTVAHVQRNHISTDDPRYFEVAPEELDRWRLLAGDVLIIEGNGSADQIGRTALFRGEIPNCVHQNHVIRIRPDQTKIFPEFLNAFLNSPSGQSAVQHQSRSTSGLRTLSVGRIKNVLVPTPSIADQERVLARLGRATAQEQLTMRVSSAIDAELGALMPAILARAFKGEL